MDRENSTQGTLENEGDDRTRRDALGENDKSADGTGEAKWVARFNRGTAIFAQIIGTVGGIVIAFVAGTYQAQRNAPVAPTSSPPGSTSTQTAPPGNSQNKNVIMLGSGTVYKYLKAHDIVKGLSDGRGPNIPILEGPTDTAAELHASAFKADTFLLVMAADRLTALELTTQQAANPADGKSRGAPAEGQPVAQPSEAVFEVYLGADPLHLFLVAGFEGDSPKPVGADFPDILDAISKDESRADRLDFKKIFETKAWLEGRYTFYSGSEESGTARLWQKWLVTQDGCNAWPSKLEFWDIRAPEDVNKPRVPRIYLGSKVLNQNLKTHLSPIVDSKDIYMVSGSKRAGRGLYLYGYVDKNQRTADERGYKLPEQVMRILKFVFQSLETSLKNKEHPLNIIESDCINDQKKYFHLTPDSDEAWVEATPPVDNIYRVPNCQGRPTDEARPGVGRAGGRAGY